jgi:hypothetical protein
MRVRFLDAAQRELDDAVAWYNQREAGLGWEFLDELDRSVRIIKSFPLAWPEIDPGIRRCLLARFPYSEIIPGHTPHRRLSQRTEENNRELV